MDYKKLIGTIIGVTLFAILIAGATFAWLTFGTTLVSNTANGTTMNFVVDYQAGNAVHYLPILDSLYAKAGVSSTGGVGTSETTLEANEASGLVVVVKKNNSVNTADGHVVIKLTTTSTTDLTTDGVVRWAICRDATVEATGEQKDNVCGGGTDFTNALNTGKITGSGTIVLLNDARLAEDKTCTKNTIAKNTQDGVFTTIPAAGGLAKSDVTCTTLSNNDTGTADKDAMMVTSGVSYFVYFWLDGLTLDNTHLDDQYDANGNGVKDAGETTIVKNLYEGYIHASANQLQD